LAKHRRGSSIEVALILEDDAQLATNFNEKWQTLSPNIPEDFDMVYLYHYPERTILLETTPPHISRPLYPFCFHGYLMSKKGAQKILRQLFPVTKPIDTALDRLYLSKFNFWRTLNVLLGHQYTADEDSIILYAITPDLLSTKPLPTNIQLKEE